MTAERLICWPCEPHRLGLLEQIDRGIRLPPLECQEGRHDRAGLDCAAIAQGPAPRRAPEPCEESCPGWAVFYVDGVREGEPENSDWDRLEIERCDQCWIGVPYAPWDEDFARFEVCRTALEQARAEESAA